jgi:methyl-accepting chemotaxis protein
MITPNFIFILDPNWDKQVDIRSNRLHKDYGRSQVRASTPDTSAFDVLSQTSLHLQDTTQREQRFLGGLALTLAASVFFVMLTLIGATILLNQPSLWLIVGVCIVSIFTLLFTYWCSRNPKLVKLGSWLSMVVITLVVMSLVYMYGPSQPLACYFITPVMLSLFLLPKLATLGLSVTGILYTVGIYLIAYQPPLVFPDKGITLFLSLVAWVGSLLVPSFIGMLLSHQLSQLKQVNQLAIEQAQRLHHSLVGIEHKRQFGHTVSQRISSVTAELQAIATQQTSGSEQQVVALSEVIGFLAELAATARAIEAKTEIVDGVSEEVLELSENVQQTTLAVAQTGEDGLMAVERTIQNNHTVYQLYTSLKIVLAALRQSSNKIGNIVGQLKELSDETHLLALNASIEAAGAGVYGERFEVVAQEVKELADRSRKASKTAEESLWEVEDYIKQAVEMSEGVQEQTQQAVNVATAAGEVINALALVLRRNTEEAGKIRRAATTMHTQMQEIKIVASQQRTGTGQAVETLQSLGTVAKQNVSGSVQVNSTSHDLEELSQELNLVLAA